MEGNTMASFLSTLSTIVSQMFTWVGSVGNAIIADPILTFSLGVFAVGKQNVSTINQSKTVKI